MSWICDFCLYLYHVSFRWRSFAYLCSHCIMSNVLFSIWEHLLFKGKYLILFQMPPSGGVVALLEIWSGSVTRTSAFSVFSCRKLGATQSLMAARQHIESDSDKISGLINAAILLDWREKWVGLSGTPLQWFKSELQDKSNFVLVVGLIPGKYASGSPRLNPWTSSFHFQTTLYKTMSIYAD